MKKIIFLFFVLVILTSVYINSNAQWVPMNGPRGNNVTSFASINTSIFAGTLGGGVYLSTDNGTSWNTANNGLTSMYVYTLYAVNTNLFAGTIGGAYLSTNNGTSWNTVNNGLTSPLVHSFYSQQL